jgi:cyclophilin family peptidyl-prolyl cis-trans isomerase
MKLSMLLGMAFLAGLVSVVSGARAQDKPATGPTGPEKPAEQPAPKATEANVYVIMKTSMGDIALELNREKAPISVDNFLSYAEKKHYDGTIFHRVIPTFMIQGGGFTPDMSQKKTGPGIRNEWKNGLSNTRGSIAMARLGGQADSATAQFFINTADNKFLDEPRDGAGYAVFGKVVDGMDVVDKIKAVKTGSKNGMQDVPTETVTIKEVRKMTPEEITALKAKLG